MNTSIVMADPLAALLLADIGGRADGRVSPRLRNGRRRRRFQHHSRLLKKLA